MPAPHLPPLALTSPPEMVMWLPSAALSAADARAPIAADGADLAAGDSDVAAAAVLSAADACAVEAVGGPDLAAGNGDVAAVAAEAAADA